MKNGIIAGILLLTIQQMQVFSQDLIKSSEKPPLSSKIYASYLVGGQFYNDHFLYNPGYSVLFTESYRLANSFEAGLGTGYISMLNESFVPFYIEALGYKKNSSNSPVIRFQVGYSAAWFRNKDFPSDYKLSGGLYFNAGMGRKIHLRNRYSVIFLLSYYHQSGSIDYQIFGSNDFTSKASYDMFQISFGFIRD